MELAFIADCRNPAAGNPFSMKLGIALKTKEEDSQEDNPEMNCISLYIVIFAEANQSKWMSVTRSLRMLSNLLKTHGSEAGTGTGRCMKGGWSETGRYLRKKVV